MDEVPAPTPTAAAPAARNARLEDRDGDLVGKLPIPPFHQRPTLVVWHKRTFAYHGTLPMAPGNPLSDVDVYRETFSYVVPEPGQGATFLSGELEQLAELRRFKADVLDPLMQPSRHGTILTRLVNALYGATASTTAGAVARAQAAQVGR